MSGQRRGGLRLWSGHDGDGPVAVGISGAHAPDDQDEAFKVAHDSCIAQAGRRRAGPVEGLTWSYHVDGPAVLRELGVTPDAQLHTFLRASPTSVLVVALAATDRRPRRSGRRR